MITRETRSKCGYFWADLTL